MNQDRVKQAMAYYVSQGFSPEDAAALVGNFMGEAGPELNPEQKEIGHEDRGFGLAQWTAKDRKAGLEAHAKELGKPISDFDVQLSYALKEWNSPAMQKMREAVAGAGDLSGKALAVEKYFESPASLADAGKRAGFANQALALYRGGSSDKSPFPQATPLTKARSMVADASGSIVPVNESIEDKVMRLRSVMAEPAETNDDKLTSLNLLMKENSLEGKIGALRKTMAEAGVAEPLAKPEPEEESKHSWYTELALDAAMWGTAVGGGIIAGSAGLPALAATGIAVGLYEGQKVLARYSRGEDPKKLDSTIPELFGANESLRPLYTVGEDVLFMGGLGKLFKVAKGSVLPTSMAGKILRGIEVNAHKPFEYASQKLWQPVADAVWNNVVVGLKSPLNWKMFPGKWAALGEDAGKVSFRELMQPGVNRLADAGSPAAGTFRRGLAMKDLTTQIGRSAIGPEFNQLKPSEQLDFFRLASGAKPSVIASQEAKTLWGKWQSLVGEAGTEKFYKTTLDQELSKGISKKLFETESATAADLGEVEDLLKLYEGKVGIGAKAKIDPNTGRPIPGRRSKDINQVLEDALNHPGLSDEMRGFIGDLRMMNSRVPLEIADASRKASTAYLVNKLQRMPNLVLEPHVKSDFFKGQRLPESIESSLVQALREGKPALKRRMEQVLQGKNLLKGEDWIPEGYIKSNYGKFRGKYLPRDVELELEAIARVPKIAKGAYQKYFLSPFKAAATVLRPGYHAVVNLGNLVLNDWGGLPFYRADIYMDALRGMAGKSKEWMDFARMTGAGGSWIQSDIYQLAEGMKYGSGMIDKLYNTFEKVVQPASSFSQSSMNMFKFAKYLHNTRELGMGASEAAWDAQKWICHFGEATPAVVKLATSKIGMPFARWESRILPLMAETAVKHPLRFFKWIAFGQALQSHGLQAVGMSPEEWEDIKGMMPEYLRGGGFLVMPWRDDKGKLNLLNASHLMPGLPQLSHFMGAFGNLGEGKIGDAITGFGKAAYQEATSNPFYNIAAAYTSNRKHSGAPLYYEWEDPEVKAGKAFAYAWESLVPGLVPGGLDFNKIWNSFGNDPQALSPEQAVASSLGFRLTAVDEVDLARRQVALRRIHEAEMKGQMQKELRAAGSDEEVNEILSKYQRLREGLQ